MKKIIAVLAAAVIVAAPGEATAYAGVHHSTSVEVSYAVCSAENCAKTGLHAHNGICYKAHFFEDGHDYHEYCAVSGCALTGYHKHGGIFFFGHAINGGNGHGVDTVNRNCH